MNKKNLQSPLISIVMPVFNPPAAILRESISSVIDQKYEKWELCVVDTSTKNDIKFVLKEFENDPKIKIKFSKNEGISKNTNLAITMAKGNFIGFLDHDDVLESSALLEVAKIIENDEKIDIIYSDNDKITEGGKQFNPLRKPGWSPELLLTCNYVTHFLVIRKNLIDEVGGFDAQLDGAQDWDLILRCFEKTNKIAHIPKILYHWRVLEYSTAVDKDSKPYALNAQISSVTNFFNRKGINAYFIHNENGYLVLKAPYYQPKISIIIYFKENPENLKTCIEGLIGTDYTNFEIIIANCGKLKNFELEINEKEITILDLPKSKKIDALNFSAEQVKGEFILFLTEKAIILHKEWLKELVKLMVIDSVGVVSPKILDEKNIIKCVGMLFEQNGDIYYPFSEIPNLKSLWTNYGDINWYRNFNAVSGACFLVRRSLFNQINGFKNLVDYDIEFCMNVKKINYRIVYNPESEILIKGVAKTLQPKLTDIQFNFEDEYYNKNMFLKSQ